MNPRSLKRADVIGTVLGAVFALAALVPGALASIPCLGCLGNLITWGMAATVGAGAGFFAALAADYRRARLRDSGRVWANHSTPEPDGTPSTSVALRGNVRTDIPRINRGRP